MTKVVPPKLYKYQSVANNPYMFENLKKAQIWFSKPYHFNDPFDCSILFRYPNANKEYQELYDQLIRWYTAHGEHDKIREMEIQFLSKGKLNKEFKSDIKNAHVHENQKKIDKFLQMGVACFTENFDNILMWSHYADSHKGLCLEFDTRYFPFSEHEKLQRVMYSSSYPLLSPAAPFQLTNLPIDPLITKSKSWGYEKEWRLISEKGDMAFEYDPKALTAIYFGCSMSKDQIKKIVTLPAKSAARLFQMIRSNTKFKLIPVLHRE